MKKNEVIRFPVFLSRILTRVLPLKKKKKGFAIPSFRAGGGIPAINYSHGTGSPYFLSRYGNGKLPRSLALSVFVHSDPVPALFYRFIPFLVAKW